MERVDHGKVPAWFKLLLALILAAYVWEILLPWGDSWVEQVHPTLHRTYSSALLAIILVPLNAWTWGVGWNHPGPLRAGRGAAAVSIVISAVLRSEEHTSE